MIYYFDASALVKRYVRETGSAGVRRLLQEGLPCTSRISEVEVISAVMRRFREGALSARSRDRILGAVQRDLESFYVVEITSAITVTARKLLARHPLRAGDAIQLASVVYLGQELSEQVPLVAFDDRLSSAAADEGVPVKSIR